MSDLTEYARHLERHPDEAERIRRGLSTQVTWFFRNRSFFELLQRHVLAALPAGHPLAPARILSAGCATGEEAYSIALLLAARAEGPQVRVLGLDLDAEAIAVARKGVYAHERVRLVPSGLARRFLEPLGDGRVRVVPQAARHVGFLVGPLHDLPARAAYDLVVCRNVLIYLERAAQRALLERFVGMLRPGGYLALGRAEHVPGGPASAGLTTVNGAERIYRLP